MFKSKIIGKSYFRRKNCQMSHFWKNQGKNGEKLDRSQKKQGKARSKLGKSQIEARFSARFEARSSSKNQVKASYLALFSISKLEARFFSSQIVQLGQKLARFPTLVYRGDQSNQVSSLIQTTRWKRRERPGVNSDGDQTK